MQEKQRTMCGFPLQQSSLGFARDDETGRWLPDNPKDVLTHVFFVKSYTFPYKSGL